MTHVGTLGRLVFVVAAAMGVVACSGSSALDVSDAAPADALGEPADAGVRTPDATALDASGADADGLTDAAASIDADAIDAGGCDYLDLEVWISECAAGHTYIHHWERLSGPLDGCPDYYTVGGIRYDTLEAIGNALTCETSCLRAPAESASLIRCGHRTGFIYYSDMGDDCPGLYETPDGLFASVEAWEAAAPCP